MRERFFSKGIFVEGLRRTKSLSLLVCATYMLFSVSTLIENKGMGANKNSFETLYDAARDQLWIVYIGAFLIALVSYGVFFNQKNSDFYGALPVNKSAAFISLTVTSFIQTLWPLLATTAVNIAIKKIFFKSGENYIFEEYFTFIMNVILVSFRINASVALGTVVTRKMNLATYCGIFLCFVPELVFVMRQTAAEEFLLDIFKNVQYWHVFDSTMTYFAGKGMSQNFRIGLFSLLIGGILYAPALIVAFTDKGLKQDRMPALFQVAVELLLAVAPVAALCGTANLYSMFAISSVVFLSAQMWMIGMGVLHVITNRGFKRMKLFALSCALSLALIPTFVVESRIAALPSVLPVKTAYVKIGNINNTSFAHNLENVKIYDKDVIEDAVNPEAPIDLDESTTYTKYIYTTVIKTNGLGLKKKTNSELGEKVVEYLRENERINEKCVELPTKKCINVMSLDGVEITDRKMIGEIYDSLQKEFGQLSLEYKHTYSSFTGSIGYSGCSVLTVQGRHNGRLYTNEFYLTNTVLGETYSIASAYVNDIK